MKKKTFLAVALASIIAGVAMGGVYDELFIVPNKAYVPSATVDIYIDGESWVNGSELDWGTADKGYVYYCNLTVQNSGDSNCTVYLTHDLTEPNWTFTWTANNTFLEPNKAATGDLKVYVPITTETGLYYRWNMYILAEQT